METNDSTRILVNGNSTSSHISSMSPFLVHLFTLLYISASVIGSFANIGILLAFFTMRKLRTRINYFLASLAVSDLVMLTIYLPFEIEWHVRTFFKHSATVCDFVYTLFFITISSSCLNLMAVSGYRFFTIAYPFWSKKITKTHVFYCIAIIWFYSCMTALLPVMGWRDRPSQVINKMCWFQYKPEFIVFLMGINWMLPALVVFVCYAMILRIARIQAQKIAKSQVLGALSDRERKRNRHQLRGAISLAKIVAVYLVCWLPYIIIGFVGQLNQTFSIPREGNYLIIFLVYSNATINPFLYAGLCEDFKEAFRKQARNAVAFLGDIPRNTRVFFRKGICRFCPTFELRRRDSSCRRQRNCTGGSSSSIYHQAVTVLSSAA
ncbi:octopamine receptor [Nematostella vectensis]|uniref:octopamine receptor n=1 Tax=Nematostella vectensis TaxID=45351 RepID=UPI00139033C4|nr:octopamine receptor [Nematostella vectensis]